jgi:hypothetical protein
MKFYTHFYREIILNINQELTAVLFMGRMQNVEYEIIARSRAKCERLNVKRLWFDLLHKIFAKSSANSIFHTNFLKS